VPPPDDDDAFDPSPTEVLTDGSAAGAFDPQATEQLAAPGPKAMGPIDSEADTAATPMGAGSDTATGEGPTAPDLKGRPSAPDAPATALIPGHALGLDSQLELNDLSSSKFLGGAAEVTADPFAVPQAETSTSGGPSPIVDDERAETPYDPTGQWEGVPLAKPLEPTGETLAPAAEDDGRRRGGAALLLAALGLLVVGGLAAWWFLAQKAPAPVASDVAPPPAPVKVAPVPEPTPEPAAEPAPAPADDDDDDEVGERDAVEEHDGKQRRTKRKRRRARTRRKRSERTVAAAPAAGNTTMSVGKLKDVSGAGITSLRPVLAKTLKRKLKGHRGVHLVARRAQEGYVIDAWVQNVRKKKVDGGNMVEVSCSAALSEQPGGGVKFNTRATTGVGVSEALNRALIEELAHDALVRCVGEMAKDIGRYGAQKAR
jgi:hypothetical protein